MKSLGLSYEVVVNKISFFELQNIFKGLQAVEAENNIIQSRIIDNNILLKSKKTVEKYKDLGKEFEDIYKKHGVKIVRGPNIAAIKMMKKAQDEARSKRK